MSCFKQISETSQHGLPLPSPIKLQNLWKYATNKYINCPWIIITIITDFLETVSSWFGRLLNLLIMTQASVHDIAGALSEAIGAAFEIHKKYFYLRKRLSFRTPLGFGVRSREKTVGMRIALPSRSVSRDKNAYLSKLRIVG